MYNTFKCKRTEWYVNWSVIKKSPGAIQPPSQIILIPLFFMNCELCAGRSFILLFVLFRKFDFFLLTITLHKHLCTTYERVITKSKKIVDQMQSIHHFVV